MNDLEAWGLESDILGGDPPARPATGQEPPGYFDVAAPKQFAAVGAGGKQKYVKQEAAPALSDLTTVSQLARHGVEPHMMHGPCWSNPPPLESNAKDLAMQTLGINPEQYRQFMRLTAIQGEKFQAWAAGSPAMVTPTGFPGFPASTSSDWSGNLPGVGGLSGGLGGGMFGGLDSHIPNVTPDQQVMCHPRRPTVSACGVTVHTAACPSRYDGA